MKYLFAVCPVLLIVILASCSSISVKYDYDPAADFSTYKTFKWVDVNIANDMLTKNPLIGKRVKEATVKGLEAKGYTYTEEDEADFAVVAHAGAKDKMQVTDWGSSGWYNPWWGPYGGRVDVSYYTEGSLVIDIVDVEQKELAWRGVATGTVQENPDPEKAQERIDKVVTQILANFPPPAK